MKNNDIINENKNNVLDVEEMAFYNEFDLASKLLISWKNKAEEAKSTKTLKELTACANALARIGVYVNQMQTRQREFNIQLGRFRIAKLQAEAETKKAKQELKDYKTKL